MRLTGALFLALSMFVTSKSASSAAEAKETARIHFAIQFDSGDPIAGEATCTLGMHCQIFQSQMPSMDVYLDLHRERDRVDGEIELNCSEGCSFADGRRSHWIGNECQFDFYEGSEMVERLLVLRPKTRIGRILLSLPNCRTSRSR